MPLERGVVRSLGRVDLLLYAGPLLVELPLLVPVLGEGSEALRGSLGCEELDDADVFEDVHLIVLLVVFVITLGLELIEFFPRALLREQLLQLDVRHRFLLLDAFLRVVERGADDSEGQIEEEERADEDEWHEEEEDVVGVDLLVKHHQVRPALQRHALEDGEEGPENVIEARHIVVRVEDALAAEVALLTDADAAADDFVSHLVRLHGSGVEVDAALAQHAREEVDSADREDQEEENQYDKRVREQGQRTQDG